MRLWLLAPLLFASTWVRADLTAEVDAIRVQYGVPALAVARVQGGKLDLSAFTGVRKSGDATAVQATDQFHLGSCTKAMTATLIGMLVEEGKLRWDSSLGEIFPELSMNPAYRSVTLELLGAHRAGLPANVADLDPALWRKLWGLDARSGRQAVLESILAAEPATPPGSSYVYSNVGYMILGSVIDRLSGTTWEQQIQEKLFNPLGMSSCGLGPAGDPQAALPDQPWGHKKTASGLLPIAPTADSDNPPAMNSAGNVHCSLAHWGRFLAMHLDGDQGKTGLLLRPETFAKLHAAYPGQEYTYGGWILTDRAWAGGRVLTHEGSNTLNLASVWIAPLQGKLFMAATNLATPEARQAYSAALLRAIQSP
jgi:D-alanyl-D-alanine carboxypeptidase